MFHLVNKTNVNTFKLTYIFFAEVSQILLTRIACLPQNDQQEKITSYIKYLNRKLPTLGINTSNRTTLIVKMTPTAISTNCIFTFLPVTVKDGISRIITRAMVYTEAAMYLPEE